MAEMVRRQVTGAMGETSWLLAEMSHLPALVSQGLEGGAVLVGLVFARRTSPSGASAGMAAGAAMLLSSRARMTWIRCGEARTARLGKMATPEMTLLVHQGGWVRRMMWHACQGELEAWALTWSAVPAVTAAIVARAVVHAAARAEREPGDWLATAAGGARAAGQMARIALLAEPVGTGETPVTGKADRAGGAATPGPTSHRAALGASRPPQAVPAAIPRHPETLAMEVRVDKAPPTARLELLEVQASPMMAALARAEISPTPAPSRAPSPDATGTLIA